MRRLIGVMALLLLVAAVLLVLRQPRRSTIEATDVSATTPPTIQTTDTSAQDSTTTLAEVDTTAAETTLATTTTLPPDAAAEFAVTEIQFGENGFVAIANVGTGAGNLGGYALCSRPQYFQIPPIELEPLETVWLAIGDGANLEGGAGIAKAVIPMNGLLGPVGRTGGELALYRTSAFADPEQMVTYVEWGVAGHGRSEVAIEAGLWEPDAFITIPADAFGIQSLAGTIRPAAGPEDWTAGVGG